uniref:Protein-tyrosine sulfotransferase n=1 Tax=Elaeophora elaphi TaxID=1147741 RepID=A0A0R3RQQ6_9BILA
MISIPLSDFLWKRNLRYKLSAMLMRRHLRTIILTIVLLSCILYMLISASTLYSAFNLFRNNFVILPGRKLGNLSKYSPLIFIGGVPRSGTTLIRAMMDAHPAVRCGEETRVIPRILGLRTQWKKSEKEWNRLQEAGVTDEVIDDAISSFMLQVIAGHGEPAERLCNKDPFTMKSAEYLAELFPSSKFIMMIRDGRATVHSIISRHVTITGFDLNDPKQCLDKWNTAIKMMYEQCNTVGPKRCLFVYYEQLVLHPEQQMRRILDFLDIPWNDIVLHHDEVIGKDIALSKVERSTDQIIKPVNLDALTKWVGTYSDDIVRDMASIAPMLAVLGYDPNANPPKYGEPDPVVLKNTDEVHMNKEEWDRKAKEVAET